jgi:recombinational DNA repair ATPase RecF
MSLDRFDFKFLFTFDMVISNEQQQFADHAEGALVRIRLRNFLTYTHTNFFPGPNMNMVIGPNGTGKSTIVCAIALGMGGHPNVIVLLT